MSNNNTLTASQLNNTEQNQVQFNISIFEIVDGKINLTKIAQSQNKSIKEWLKNKSTMSYLSALTQARGNSPQLEIVNGVGTFGTREVALKLAQWISPNFEVFCIEKIDTLLQTGKVELKKPESKMDLILQFQDALNMAVIEIKEKDRIIELQAPKVDLAETYLENGANMNLSTCAKTLGIKVTELTAFLYSKPYIFDQRGNKVPYAEYTELFYCKPFVALNGHSGHQLLVTPTGLEKLSKALKPKNILQKIGNFLAF